MRIIACTVFCFLLASMCSCQQKSEAERNAPKGMELVWHDEFDGDSLLDDRDWTYEEGFVRNRELQWYQKDNAFCENGFLVIEGRHERKENPYMKRFREYEARMQQQQGQQAQQGQQRRQGQQAQQGQQGQRRQGQGQRRQFREDWKMRDYADYTSSSVTTKGRHEFLFGTFMIRARIPVAKGSWPAIWTLGTEKGWVNGGEIDIMEYYLVDSVPTILANVACAGERGAKWNTQRIPYAHFLEKDAEWGEKFHTWRMDWDSTAIRLYLDDELLNETLLKDTWNAGEEKYNPFLHPQYLLLNLALGSSGGVPDSTLYPIRYEIDWVRVYQTPEQREAQEGKKGAFNPGKVWRDTDGNAINAHGGGILTMPDKYYWFGEHKGAGSTSAFVGVTCYSSTDLLNWKYEGVALSVSDNPESEITSGCTIERPKVIYNEKTGKYVMWFHLELKGRGYEAALAAVAVSDTPQGPYTYLGSARPNAGCLPMGMTQADMDEMKNYQIAPRGQDNDHAWREATENGYYAARDFAGGQMARDQTVFVDDDGKAYHIYSAEENYTLNIAELSDDYLSHTGKWMRVAPGGHNEAPAIFKKDGLYWMITSGCTGWAPNAARMFSSPTIWGEWTQYDNPCVGPNRELTFGSQSTYILPVPNEKDTTYIFIADVWKPQNPIDSRYIWLPISFGNDGVPVIQWQDNWMLP